MQNELFEVKPQYARLYSELTVEEKHLPRLVMEEDTTLGEAFAAYMNGIVVCFPGNWYMVRRNK